MKMFKYLLVTVSILFLTACSQINETSDIEGNTSVSELNEDLSSYPKGVQDGYITTEYYNTIKSMKKMYIDVSEVSMGYYNAPSHKKTDLVKSKMSDMQSDFLLITKTVNIEPSTKVEYMIHENFESMIYHMKTFNEYMMEYMSNEKEVFVNLAIDEHDKVRTDLTFIENVLKKYDIE